VAHGKSTSTQDEARDAAVLERLDGSISEAIMSRVIVIGETPGTGMPKPKQTAKGRFAALAGLTFGQVDEYVEWINVLREPPANGWPRSAAHDAARDLAPDLRGRDVLLLGQKVAEAFELTKGGRYPLLLWTKGVLHAVRCRYALIPHPSGLNRWYNDPSNRSWAEDFVTDALGLRRQGGLY
jgi:hypothetical protein